MLLGDMTIEQILSAKNVQLPYQQLHKSFVSPNENQLPPKPDLPPRTVDPQYLMKMMPQSDNTAPSRLVALPSELINHILTYLSGIDLACLGRTCRKLSEHTRNDLLWAKLVNENLPSPIPNAGPFDSFRTLYIAHYPYWFVVRNKIWFSDAEHTGKLILARYDNRRGVIEGFRVVAERGTHSFQPWELNSDVIIATFNPKVSLWLDDPVIHLKNNMASPLTKRQYLHGEIQMHMAAESQQVYSSFSLCANNQAEKRSSRADQLWPPTTIPSEHRVYRHSDTHWTQWDDLPQRRDEISESAFRIRKWARFRLGFPIYATGSHETLSTFATLDPSLYTPSKEKPYQGIWVGDYADHGCEFMLLIQRHEPLQEPDDSAVAYSGTGTSFLDLLSRRAVPPSSSLVPNGSSRSSDNNNPQQNLDQHEDSRNNNDIGESGNLTAIKLTGDPNVPRGQITFMAEDLGPGGTVRIAEERPFQGARVIRSKGHVALENFRDDRFIKTEIFLISHDCIAQYWAAVEHISFYRRVDIDSLLKV